ncbi:alpha/beta hydrolase [Flavobacterium succinicans]|uniref:2-hydroxy-6-oxononadienedioate/2-hydroxy-6-oxononatrienedioate hydrolase n=1 Tax=Flavobacterium succinicans TaxID=29536 RepID=A0A199XW73_9FLAO|nr:alpha/beta hydrolase [Flavobacterium succinicans]OAZ05511.1 2-hydroxy-6-oxononadienedioate/2-hydroxy-6-oxononatrienedioate hydrolase [Flavobacterium succinicans]
MPKRKTNAAKNLRIPKIIIVTAKLFAFISTKLVTRFAAKLFVTPIKHKTPKREYDMDSKCAKHILDVKAIDKKIMTYHFGDSNQKILLVHGWSGRGTQLFKIAEELLKNGYSTISFDAPAHGKSPGSTSIMTDFIESILEIDQQFGPFEAIIGHSLGGMSTLNAIKRGLNVKNATVIGSGDVVQDIVDDFVLKLKINPKIGNHLRAYFEKKHNIIMDDFSAYKAAAEITIPILVIHDHNDAEVPVSAGIHIHEHCQKGTLFLTHNLGHRKILGDKEVVDSTVSFVKKASQIK